LCKSIPTIILLFAMVEFLSSFGYLLYQKIIRFSTFS